MRFATLVALYLLTVTPASADRIPPEGNGIFVTIDGVRWQEFFRGVQKPSRAGKPLGTSLFPKIQAMAKHGEAWIYGDGETGGTFRVANRAALSLPGYRGLLSGEFEDRCRTNSCANIDRETIFDGLIDRGFAARDLAAFTSWNGLGRALERHPGRITRDVDHDDYPKGVGADEANEAAAITARARADLPLWGARKDVYTHALANLYLDHHRPRFLYLSMLDSDEFGHLDQYRNYVDSLGHYDDWISDLRDKLRDMGAYGANTTIVLTTDHGRGNGLFWVSHGMWLPSAFRTWAVVIPSTQLRTMGKYRPRIAKSYSQVDLRPTIETLLGIVAEPTETRPGLPLIEPIAKPAFAEISPRSSTLATRR